MVLAIACRNPPLDLVSSSCVQLIKEIKLAKREKFKAENICVYFTDETNDLSKPFPNITASKLTENSNKLETIEKICNLKPIIYFY